MLQFEKEKLQLPIIKLNDKGYNSIKLLHPWIYQRSCVNIPNNLSNGELVAVEYKDNIVGVGFFFSNSLFALKILEFNCSDIDLKKIVRKKIENALFLRKDKLQEKNCVLRLFNAEADGIPGVVIELYDKILVIQYHNSAVEILDKLIIAQLTDLLNITDISIFEIRANNQRGWLLNPRHLPFECEIDGIKMLIDFNLQKTGYYLDQRENRKFIQTIVKNGMRVLDAFAYTGAFALYCLKADAIVDIIEVSKNSCEIFAKTCELNNFRNYNIFCGRVEKILAELPADIKYDLILLDPPALATNKNQLKNALKYISKIFELSLTKIKDNGIITVSVCSLALTGIELKQTLVSSAAKHNFRLRLLDERRAATDHTILLNFPEGDYLRFLALQVIKY